MSHHSKCRFLNFKLKGCISRYILTYLLTIWVDWVRYWNCSFGESFSDNFFFEWHSKMEFSHLVHQWTHTFKTYENILWPRNLSETNYGPRAKLIEKPYSKGLSWKCWRSLKKLRPIERILCAIYKNKAWENVLTFTWVQR